jgi:outer membrane protein OmpA-like peptidoglycan-associated protein
VSAQTFDSLKEAGANSGMLSNITDLLSSDQNSATGGIVSKVLSGVLGNNLTGIISGISKFSGISNGSSTGLLSMVGGLISGFLGKKIVNEGLSLSSFSSLLNNDSKSFATAIPSGFSNSLGLGNVVESNISNTAAAASHSANTVRESVEQSGSSLMRWLLPIILFMLLLALLAYFFKGCGNGNGKGGHATAGAHGDSTKIDAHAGHNHAAGEGHGATATAGATAGTATDAAAIAAKKTADSLAAIAANATATAAAAVPSVKLNADGTAAYDLGAMTTKKLPNGTEIKYAERGSEAELLKFIESGTVNEADKSKGWISLYDVQFTKGTTYAAAAAGQVKNVAAILKAYPNVNLKLGGYTDNTGGAEINQKISLSRAEKVKADLAAAGVGAQITKAEGYGPEFPACAANDTPECKAQNRRVSCRVVKK